MARIRTLNEIISSWTEYILTRQPNASTNPGSLIKDFLIDAPSVIVSQLYEEANRIKIAQSFNTSTGQDVDKWLKNFDFSRGKGSKATVAALLTFNDLSADIAINRGDIITAKNGATFVIQNSQNITSVNSNSYRATASKYRGDLDFLNINDQFAVEILSECSTTGTQGNISKYGLQSTNIVGINNVTNVKPGSGGNSAQNDATTKRSFIAAINGANGSTSTGYKNAVLTDPGILDAIIIEPGDVLMIRDGTQVQTLENGEMIIISEGAGGKFDIIIYGNRLQSAVNSFIYRDQSNTNNPTHSDNDFVLGQLDNFGKTVIRRRREDLTNSILPTQPISTITKVSGTFSGPNFQEKVIDSLGRTTGNYELLKDTGVYSGSPWSFDKLHWISDRIVNYVEDKTKGTFNGQDSLNFSDVTEIKTVQQNINILNENGLISTSNRSSIKLLHTPLINVTRVRNLTTGEQYVVTSQNPDNPSNTFNTTGNITISGKSLPSINDTLQIDYTWIFSFDRSFDYDNKKFSQNLRSSVDSVDWGYSNLVRRERSIISSSGSTFMTTVTHPISSIVSINSFVEETSTISLVFNRLSVVVNISVSNVISIIRTQDDFELWNTSTDDGTFSGQTIFLPTDTSGILNQEVRVVYNAVDLFNSVPSGSFDNNTITLPNTLDLADGYQVECNYIANVNVLLSNVTLNNLPAVRNGNSFNTSSLIQTGVQPCTNIFNTDGSILQNLRQAPSNLALTISGNFSPGTLTISGITLIPYVDIIFTASSNGLTQDLSAAIRQALNINSITSIPSNISIGRISSLEKIETTSNLEVLNVLAEYDLIGYQILNNFLVKNETLPNSSLSNTQFILPSTTNNNNNLPQIGDRLRVSFHILTQSDSENIFFSRAGTQYSSKKFAIIDTCFISSGFTSTASNNSVLTISNFNQPATKSRYKATYDYLAPKTNERITIDFNYDRAVTDATLAIEPKRNPGDDVLVKAATPILIDVTMNIVVNSNITDPSAASVVLQNVQDAVTRAINSEKLGTELDSSDLISVASNVTGVDRVRIIYFNINGVVGNTLTITAQKNQYLRANLIQVELETK